MRNIFYLGMLVVLFIVSILTPTTSSAQTVVSVQPAEVPSPAVGGQLTVNLTITGGVGVAGYQITVNFDPTALRYVSSRNADYLPAGAFVAPANTTDSSVTIAATALGGSNSGNGTLATVTFQVVEVKTSTLRLTDAVLSGAADDPLDFTTADGIVTVQDTPSLTDVYMYWADIETNKIQRANLDGTNVQDILTGFGRPTGITLDISRGKIYWTDSDRAGGYGILRMNLDGTNVETLVVGEPFVGEQMALDISGGKMYWAATLNKIKRANLDGTNVEDLVVGQEYPRGIALDLSRGKMYWTDRGTGKIQRANLDGSNIEALLTGLDNPHYVALDFNSGKLYWTSLDAGGRIQRANFDGSNLEDIVIGLDYPIGIALDSLNGKMYWVERGSDRIQRANLDGTNVETLVTGLRFPVGIALSIPQTPSGLRFDPNLIADQRFTVDIPVDMTLPIAVGGTAPYTYSISALPAGLYFDPTTRQIRGTPTVVGTYPATYTATDTTGEAASLTFTITVTAPLSLEDGLVLYLSFDNNTIQGNTVQDLSGTGNNGTIYGGARTSTGKHGEALAFDGVDDFVEVPLTDSITFSIGDSFTVQAWIKTDDQPQLNDGIVSNYRHHTNKKWGLAIHGDFPALRGTVDFSVGEIGRGVGIRSSDSLNNGEWHRLTGVRDQEARKTRFYVNGELIGEVDDGNRLIDPNSGQSIWIGEHLYRYYNGLIDEVRVWDRALTPEEIGSPQSPGGLRFSPNVIAGQTFTVGTSVSLTLPTATGATSPYTYTLVPTLPAGLYFDPIANGPGYIGGTPTAAIPSTPFTYTATDATGASASLTFTITVELNLDVNGDGQVDVLDLVWVAVSYGMRGTALPADVNADGVVNVQDLVAVAAGIDAAATLPAKIAEEVLLAAEAAAVELEGAAGAPVMGFYAHPQGASNITAYRNVANALSDVRSLRTGDVRLGEWLPLLEELLQVLAEMKAIPETTALLPNYPNPFNPETWIPYHLATDAEVTLTIYDIRGVAVRELVLGHQSAGVYESRGRAAYWDGRNQLGEKVASGLYFYTLTAGEFTATRKLLIAK